MSGLNYEEYIKKYKEKIQEISEFIYLVHNVIEDLDLSFDYPDSKNIQVYYDAEIDTEKGKFIVTVIDVCSKLFYYRTRDSVAICNCSAIIVLKRDLLENIKNEIERHNEGKENKIYYIVGDTKEKIRERLISIVG
jgi:predicted membrane-bound dolichyl-phosphate-mannose-protein mannosyltransferase